MLNINLIALFSSTFDLKSKMYVSMGKNKIESKSWGEWY